MKTIQFSCVINKAADVVWDMWSTKKGIEKFFCENTRIDFEVGGRFEILFDMTVEEGLRGSEGMEIIAFEPMSRIGFTWNAPPSIMAKRGQKTVVYVELEEHENHKTKVSLFHSGFGNDKDWVSCYAYFVRAWGELVLPRLIYATEMGKVVPDGEFDLSPYVNRVV